MSEDSESIDTVIDLPTQGDNTRTHEVTRASVYSVSNDLLSNPISRKLPIFKMGNQKSVIANYLSLDSGQRAGNFLAINRKKSIYQ